VVQLKRALLFLDLAQTKETHMFKIIGQEIVGPAGLEITTLAMKLGDVVFIQTVVYNMRQGSQSSDLVVVHDVDLKQDGDKITLVKKTKKTKKTKGETL